MRWESEKACIYTTQNAVSSSIYIFFTQIFGGHFFRNLILDQDSTEQENELIMKPFCVGKGRSKLGKRQKWTKKNYFEQDLNATLLKKLKVTGFSRKFAGFYPHELDFFFEQIKSKAIRPRETVFHARNKLLLWIDRNHNKLSWNQVAADYQIGVATGKGYVTDVENAILNAFENSNIISFPSEDNKIKMVEILKKKKAHMPNALFTLDGKHARCTGKQHSERLSWKYRWQPCFNCLFVIERVFGTVCAFNLDHEAKKHDITILRESTFFQNIDEELNGWTILADKGYIGIETDLIAPAHKRESRKRKEFNKATKNCKSFWKAFNDARNDSERAFAQFFYNKFPLLGNWPGKSKNTFNEWARSVVCCIVLYNSIRMKNQQLL